MKTHRNTRSILIAILSLAILAMGAIPAFAEAPAVTETVTSDLVVNMSCYNQDMTTADVTFAEIGPDANVTIEWPGVDNTTESMVVVVYLDEVYPLSYGVTNITLPVTDTAQSMTLINYGVRSLEAQVMATNATNTGYSYGQKPYVDEDTMPDEVMVLTIPGRTDGQGSFVDLDVDECSLTISGGNNSCSVQVAGVDKYFFSNGATDEFIVGETVVNKGVRVANYGPEGVHLIVEVRH